MKLIKNLLLLLMFALCSGAWASDLVFAVTEGVTYQTTNRETQTRFQPLANALAKALQRPVTLTIVPAYKDLREGLNYQHYDLAFVHPAHIALNATKSAKYRTLAWTEGFTDYAVSVLVKPSSPPLARMSDLKGKTLVTTDPDSITAAMVKAVLREQGLGHGDIQISNTKYQDALPFYLEKGFAQGAATAASGVVKSWLASGGKVMYTSRGLAIKTVLASSKLSPEDVDKIRAVLLSNERPVMEALGYKAFIPADPQVEIKTIAWLGL